MKFENTHVYNIVNSMHGARNPLESWAKSDSNIETETLGENDLKLAQRLIKAGAPDRKFMRQIFVSVDITAPLYWWKEADTYKIATVTNSCSTMHRLANTPITMDCFEMGDYDGELPVFENYPYTMDTTVKEIWEDTINNLETLRKLYLETKDKRYWKTLVMLLPESWLQKRTWTGNYEVLRNIWEQRCKYGHKLSEWKKFGEWLLTLPYAEELILYGLRDNKENKE